MPGVPRQHRSWPVLGSATPEPSVPPLGGHGSLPVLRRNRMVFPAASIGRNVTAYCSMPVLRKRAFQTSRTEPGILRYRVYAHA